MSVECCLLSYPSLARKYCYIYYKKWLKIWVFISNMIYMYPLSNKLFAVNVQTKFFKYIRKICSGAFNQYLNINIRSITQSYTYHFVTYGTKPKQICHQILLFVYCTIFWIPMISASMPIVSLYTQMDVHFKIGVSN